MDFDFVVKISEGDDGAYENPEDVIKYMRETNFENEISIYDISDDKAYAKTRQIYDEIKSYNKGKPLDEQILPTNPCKFRGMLGCLGVTIYSIDLGTYKKIVNVLQYFQDIMLVYWILKKRKLRLDLG